MISNKIVLLLTGALIILLLHGCGEKRAKLPTLLAQPDSIPAAWELREPLYPPLKQITSLAVDKTPVYGISMWLGEYIKYREEIIKIGWKAIRIGGPKHDEKMMVLLEDAARYGFEIFTNIAGGKKRHEFNSDESFIANSVQTARNFLKLYGPGGSFFKKNKGRTLATVTHVGIWNEPNFHYMHPKGTEDEKQKLYTKLLKVVGTVIKKDWPGVKVVGFSAGGAGRGDIRFIENVFKNDPSVINEYDILATQPYNAQSPPEANAVKKWGTYSIPGGFSDIRTIQSKYGKPLQPIWYTELGWVISKEEGGQVAEKKKDRIPLTQRLQAAYIVRVYALALRLGVGRVHLMHINDTDGFNGGILNKKDKSWRESAFAIQNMIRLMPHAQLKEVIHESKEGLYAYTFITDVNAKMKKEIIMVWNIAGPRDIELQLKGKNVMLTDMLGGAMPGKIQHGKLTLPIGPCPVYISVN